MDRPADDQPEDRSPSGTDPFEAIVSGWRNEGPVPRWPDDEPRVDGPSSPTAAPVPVVPVPVAPVPAVPDPAAPDPDARADDHFIPPEPPPIPRLGPPAVIGLGLLVLGIVLVGAPGWLGISSVYGLPLGLLTLAAGLGWLVLRLWPSAGGPGDGDDGAVV